MIEPDRPLVYGGRVQILGIELYSNTIAVNWRLAPLPDYEVVFSAELAEQEPDLEGLPEDYRKILGTNSFTSFRCEGAFLLLPMTWGLRTNRREAAPAVALVRGGGTLISLLGCRPRLKG